MKQLFLAVCLLVSAVGFAKIPQPQKNTYVNDFAGVLKPGDIRDLNAKIHRIERLADVQMAVVLIDKLPAEYDIDEYALLIGRKWHVGKHKNGLVYVAAISQHKQRLEVAQLLSDKITDEKSAEILDVIKPFFRQQDYAGGINAMIDEVTAVVAPAKSVQPVAAVPAQHVQSVAKKDEGISDTTAGIIAVCILLGIPALIIWLIVSIVRARSRRRAYEQQMMYGQPPMGYNNGYGGGYGNGPIINNYNGGSGYRSSGWGRLFGGFAAGYAARSIQDHHSHNNSGSFFGGSSSSDSSNDDRSEDRSVNSSDQDSSSWGNWGSSGSDSSSSSSNDSSSSSDNSGYTGNSGATSDW